jgi:hypothetical protein
MYEDGEGGRGLGAGFWFKLMGMAVGAIVAGAVFFLVFGWAWYAWGFFGAMLLFALVLLGFGYVHDRRQQSRYGSLPG